MVLNWVCFHAPFLASAIRVNSIALGLTKWFLIFLQSLAQVLHRPRVMHLDGVDRDVEHVGDLLIGTAFVNFQVEDRPLPRRQLPHGQPKPPHRFVGIALARRLLPPLMQIVITDVARLDDLMLADRIHGQVLGHGIEQRGQISLLP